MSETFKPGPQDIEIQEREQCFKGFYKVDRLRLRHRQFAGGADERDRKSRQLEKARRAAAVAAAGINHRAAA